VMEEEDYLHKELCVRPQDAQEILCGSVSHIFNYRVIIIQNAFRRD